MGGKNKIRGVASPESVPIHFNYMYYSFFFLLPKRICSLLGLDFHIGLPVELYPRAATLTTLQENYNMEEIMKEIFGKANQEYFQRSVAGKSPTDMKDVCYQGPVVEN